MKIEKIEFGTKVWGDAIYDGWDRGVLRVGSEVLAARCLCWSQWMGENKMKAWECAAYRRKQVLIYPAAAVTASLSWGGARCYVGVMFLCP
jgi:hypothetical protein